MTDRLYYTDPYSRDFDATVLRVDNPGDPGSPDGCASVRLDRTIFYPTSGGQPCDTGTLGPHRVVDVFDGDDGDVTHVVDVSAGPEGAEVRELGDSVLQRGRRVHGSIDWLRRFDHMQQHTGQHVLSAALDRVFGARTVAFHLGAGASTIDLARELTARELSVAEGEANRVVWEDRQVTIRFASAEEASRLPLRKESGRTGTLRLVDVEDFDLSACGGTHVARTGEVGLIAIRAWERFKGGQRVEFHCGTRALGQFRALRDTTAATARLLSVPAGELPEAVERLQTDAKDQRRRLVDLQSDLARYRAEELAAAAEATVHGRLVLRTLDADAGTLKTLAAAVVPRGGLIVVLVSTAQPALVVVARSPDIALASNRILARLTAKFGGRGGGKPDLAQGGGLDAPAEVILAEVRAMLGNEASPHTAE
jgi:alanyl-tRNA synthetase